jgi:hypothetical protein
MSLVSLWLAPRCRTCHSRAAAPAAAADPGAAAAAAAANPRSPQQSPAPAAVSLQQQRQCLQLWVVAAPMPAPAAASRAAAVCAPVGCRPRCCRHWWWWMICRMPAVQNSGDRLQTHLPTLHLALASLWLWWPQRLLAKPLKRKGSAPPPVPFKACTRSGPARSLLPLTSCCVLPGCGWLCASALSS